MQILDVVVLPLLQDLGVLPTDGGGIEHDVTFGMSAQYRAIAGKRDLFAGRSSDKWLQKGHERSPLLDEKNGLGESHHQTGLAARLDRANAANTCRTAMGRAWGVWPKTRRGGSLLVILRPCRTSGQCTSGGFPLTPTGPNFRLNHDIGRHPPIAATSFALARSIRRRVPSWGIV